jgi:chromatin remodeling complex protein RSC6
MSSAQVKNKKVVKAAEVPEKIVAAAAVVEKKGKKAEKAAPASPVPAVVAPVAPVVEDKAKRARKPRVAKEKPAATEEKVEEEKEVVKRGPATSETVMSDVLDLIAGLTTAKVGEVENLKQAVKLLKTTASRLKHLRNDLTRVLKKSTRSTTPKDKSKMSNSGLMKPVVISKELAEFMKVPADSLHSRVSVTNAICSYIKEHNLQNPNNKREINSDANLARILNYKAGSQPLTYFYIQQLIQPHFLKEISSDLASFMKVSDKSLQSSSSVNAALLAYATSKNLVNGSNVTPDETLSKLLGKTSVMTVQAMNGLVKSHFKK